AWIRLEDGEELGKNATISVSSTFALEGLPANGPWKKLSFATAQMLPLMEGVMPALTFQIKAEKPTHVKVALLKSKKKGNYTPELTVAEMKLDLALGEQTLNVDFKCNINKTEYYFVAFYPNEEVQLRYTENHLTGILTVFQKFNKAVATSSRQEAPKAIGMDSFDFWLPERRPDGQNLSFSLDKPLSLYEKAHLVNGIFRPTIRTNAWAAAIKDIQPYVELKWGTTQVINEIKLFFDTDFDHPMESTLMGHPESEIPFCIKTFKVCDGKGNTVAEVNDNHQSIYHLKLAEPLKTDKLKIVLEHPGGEIPAALFGVVCF
ncbi:MAG: FAD-binding dehydrogenase, partial [Cyclobacteriaceae bacterium]